MKVQIILNSTNEDNQETELQLIKNSLEDESIMLKISYQDITVNLKDLEKAIAYIKKGFNDE